MNEALRNVVETYLAAEEVELDDLTLGGGGTGRVLKVVVDAEGGLGLDRIADLSRGLARLLDEDETITGSYTLEVTSPGLERKLTRPAHYRKSVGREVVIATREPVAGHNSHRGLLESVADGGVIVRVDGEARQIAFDEVTRAQTVFRWEAKAKPGRK
ncbi:MAG: ribosome maturation factor RimP [Actinobacteria bacterium]|jgi:ribosome maturation factor RimP|nr:ribosome maturation factor RimP [Actinomycetota bacterium]MBU1494064.1 ribosome maturation factor RimP [Actinomycetota bacterium]